MKKVVLIFILTIIYFQMSASYIHASFGVSPADLTFDYLSPGMVVEEDYLISRTNLAKDANVIVETEIEGIGSWLKIDPGVVFTIPKGERTRTMKVTVSVPDDAVYKNYQGYLNVKLSEGGQASGVSVVQGVGIAVNLAVVRQEITILLVRKVEIPAVIVGKPILLLLAAENQGNKPAKLERVELIVRDKSGKELLRNENDNLAVVDAGKKQVLTAEFANDLSQGDYSADVSVIFQGKAINDDKLVFAVNKMVEKGEKGFKVTESNDNTWFFLLGIVLLSSVPVAFIWKILRKRVYP
jgi:hypothetical protein